MRRRLPFSLLPALMTGCTVPVPLAGLTPSISSAPRGHCIPLNTDTCAAPDTINILVGAPVSWELGRDFREDFRRVIAFDPSRATTPATPYDDRFCVYNMPTDDKEHLGNNSVIGLTWAKGRTTHNGHRQ